MSLNAVLRSFANLLILFAVAMVPPLFVGVFAREPASVAVFAMSILGASFIGGALRFAARGEGRFGLRETTSFLGLAWLVGPLFAAAPFLLIGQSWSQAYFEAVSMFTTTGASLNAGPNEGFAHALWRAELQWLGGLLSLAAAGAVFSRATLLGALVQRPTDARSEEGDLLQEVWRCFSLFATPYSALTLICAVLLAFAGAPVFDAICLGLSILSTGGYTPQTGGVTAYSGVWISPVVLLFMMVGALNMTVIARAAQFAPTSFRIDRESVALFGSLLLFTMVIYAAGGFGGLGDLGRALLAAASSATTSGFYIEAYAPPFIVAAPAAFIGGSVISTAGGLKLVRFLALMNQTGGELWRLNHPRGVAPSGGAVIANSPIPVYFLALTIVLSLMTLAIAGFGHGFEIAVAAPIAALTNTGALLTLASPGGYDVFDAPVLMLLAIGMAFGRLEILVALALFNHAFWRS